MSEYEAIGGGGGEGFDDGGGIYDDFFDGLGGAQVTPELVAQVAAQVAQQQQQAPPAEPQQPTFDPILQAHAEVMLEAVPALRDPNSHESGAFARLVQERAHQAGVPELVGDLRFARHVFDSLEPGALRPQNERTVSAIMGDGKLGGKVLPFG